SGFAGGYSGTWNKGDVILLAQTAERAATQRPPGLLRVSATGSQPTPETILDASRKEVAHLAPHFLPDGRHYLYIAASADLPPPEEKLVKPSEDIPNVAFLRSARFRAYVGTLDSQERYPLPGIESEVKYLPSGHLIFIRDGALTAQAFDAHRLK